MCNTKIHADDCSMLIVAEVKIEKLTMTHSSQSVLNGAVGSVSEAKSGGRGFKSHFKQIFALNLKLLIDYILSILASVWSRIPPSDLYT